MSRIEYSTRFSFSSQSRDVSGESGGPLRILILGDYSGRGSRGVNSGFAASAKRIIAVDKDNFDEVFSAARVEIQTPFAEETLRFDELEDLHPDYLYQQLPLFEHFRRAIFKLKKCTSHDQAKSILQEFGFAEEQSVEQGAAPSGAEFSLDALLESSGSASRASSTSAFDIQALIKDIISPYVIPAADSRVDEAEQIVWQALNHALAALMHHSSFKKLETSWRALDMMNRRLDTDAQFKLHILDVTEQELESITESGEEAETFIQFLTQRSASLAREPFDFIVLDAAVDLGGAITPERLQQLATIVAGANSQLLAGAGPKLIADLLNSSDDAAPLNIEENCTLCAPRCLLRMPFGKSTRHIDAFKFEEITNPEIPSHYLWGSGAYLSLLALPQWQSAGAMVPAKIEGLPFVAITHHDEPFIQPATEFTFSDQQADKLATAGLITAAGSANSTEILMPLRAVSLSS